MAGKRRAEVDLNQDNWNVEEEPEEKGEFKIATEDVLKQRVIRTAKRRITNAGSDSERKPIFSSFTGFATNVESKKPSFSFISNNLKSTDTVDPPKPAFSFSAGSNFNTSKSADKTSFSNTSGNPSSARSVPEILPKLRTESKVMRSEEQSFSFPSTDVAQPSPFSFFGKSVTASSKPDPKKIDDTHNFDNNAKLSKLSNDLKKTANEKQSEQTVDQKDDKIEKTPDEVFLHKIRSLNLLCAEWIIKHLNENLSYILTPIFDDYKKHLTQLREERQRASVSSKRPKTDNGDEPNTKSVSTSFAFKGADSKSSGSNFNFGPNPLLKSSSEEKEKPAGFKFSGSTPAEDRNNFKFSSFPEKKDDSAAGSSIHPENKTRGLFSFGCGQNETKTTNDNASVNVKPSSFFSFNADSTHSANPFLKQTEAPRMSETTAEDDDEPPPSVNDVTITEEGAVYDKKCKVFIKKDGNFVDHGVGFLFIKLVGDEQKCQVIVRANNQLANLIVNTLLNSSIPIQKMGKNNVMIICCPTPEAKPTSILLKVKTAEDAEELIDVLKKYIK